ncbi:phytoene synthase [Cyanobacterium sp. uoEpiScrs1]|uniref:phytoene synthase n=1 Tax=Cyanobacterium sp. uoEpiScrs1 TaxID=2976343 RepID=UPI002269EB00|nr:phytoene synthase [Cyanobacterium sp. uoEpiScrs1]
MLQLPEPPRIQGNFVSLTESYELCRQITAKFSKTFYLGTLLMRPEKRQAIWAIYVWCRRTDELVDGPQAQSTTVETLQRWEKHLKMVFSGHPIDNEDVALVDTIQRFPVKIELFQEMIAGQKMDLHRSRYESFKELQLYCYRVAGTVGLISSSVLGIKGHKYNVFWQNNRNHYIPKQEAITLGIANQLTNILRDVGEDAQRGRIYLPLEDLEKFNYTQEDLFAGVVDERWCNLMRFEIERARQYYQDAKQGIRFLCRDSRWPVWAALMLYQDILNMIEANNYDVFTKRASVRTSRKIIYILIAWLRAQVP